LPEKCEVHATFNVTDLISFTGSTDDETNILDLRTNPLQNGEGDNGRRPRQGPTSRLMTRKIKEQ